MEAAELRATVREQTERLANLRREGYTGEPNPPTLPPEEPLPMEVEKVLADLPDDPALQRQLRRQAETQLRLGVEPRTVAADLLAGENVDDLAL